VSRLWRHEKRKARVSTSGPQFSERNGNETILMDIVHHTSADVIAAVHISDVYQALTGTKPRQAGIGRFRARAIWRDGDGYNVALDDGRGCWYDHVTGEHGGVLSLVQVVRGGTKQESLRWTADLAGIELTDRPLTLMERERYRLQKAIADREGADVVAWRDGLVSTLREHRNAFLSAYHKARNYVLANGVDTPFANLMADACEFYLRKYQWLDKSIALIEAADWGFLLDWYRRTKNAETA
jgi:hypothetical protein